ncbi:hypothetical protein PIB30_085981 [Stylosanthes scabra]|uniref:Uncharacterized protein n=1 Tax=Stylosanthes scabra TaxID=79078 RepID=A0ABU6WSS3_9FABA|nr:hypothetical protein [Stylosanthes scabra]
MRIGGDETRSSTWSRHGTPEGYAVGPSCAETRAINLIDGTNLAPSGMTRSKNENLAMITKIFRTRKRTPTFKRLSVAITFDPELRLTHRLWLHRAYHLLYASNLGLRYGHDKRPAAAPAIGSEFLSFQNREYRCRGSQTRSEINSGVRQQLRCHRVATN